MKKYLLILLITNFQFVASNVSMQDHEMWWEKNLDRLMEEWKACLGDVNSPSRVIVRKYIKNLGYKSVLDAACGPCIDYYGFKVDRINIDYVGIDITPKLVKLNCAKGINVIQASVEQIPFNDATFDVAYGRHILEHLSYYEKALTELIRVAKREVIIVFFLRPGDNENEITYYPDKKLYNNRYNKTKFEQFLKTHNRVESFSWEDVHGWEIILHVLLKND